MSDREIERQFFNKKLCDMDNKQESIDNYNYVTIKNENMADNYVGIKDENIDDANIVIPESTDDKLCPNETVISGGYIKQEPHDMKDEPERIQNYLGIKDENMDELTVGVQEKLMTDCVDNKVCIYETIISERYIKQEPCEPVCEPGSIHNNINMKRCEECGEEYDLYCLKCPMLIRIFNSNNSDRSDNMVRGTLPKNFLDICKTQSGLGVLALRAIPKGVVFGPFKGLDLTKDEVISKWKLRYQELTVTKNSKCLNWMQYIRRADKSSCQNLVPFQYKGGLYYHSKCHINVGDELLVGWDSDSNESKNQEKEISNWEPQVCESLDDSYACTFCCVGYKSVSHLKVHNSTCIEKRNKKDFCEEIVQCSICKIYLDKKEYLDYHIDRCNKSNEKSVFNSCCRRNRDQTLLNGDRPFWCALCPYKAKTKACLKKHIGIHSGNKPFACTLCPYKTTANCFLKRHMAVHTQDRPFPCTFCPYKALTESILKRHMDNHNDERPFACTLCAYKTKTKSNLNQHIAIHNDAKPFACILCPYRTNYKSHLKKHITIHNDDKPFACILCPYKTNYKSCLKMHIDIHNGDKPFACTLCSYKTTRKSTLKQHIAIHNGDRPFACTLCPYKAATTSILRQHIAFHKDERPFACILCPHKSKTKSNLNRHVAIHNDDKPFACIVCPYKARTKAHLQRHIGTHNDDKP